MPVIFKIVDSRQSGPYVHCKYTSIVFWNKNRAIFDEMIPILWQLFCNHRRLKKTKNILVKRLPKVITRSPCGPILLGRHGILDHPKIENSGNTVINIIMWILTTNYWAKVKIQRISYTSLQQILTKHKVKRRRNLGSRTTTKLLGFQIHEKKSLSSL